MQHNKKTNECLPFFISNEFLFYLGQPILFLFSIDITSVMSIQSSPFSRFDINITLAFLLKAMLLFHFGTLLSVKKYKFKPFPPIDIKIISLVGMFFFAISFIPTLTSTIDSLKTSLTVGYSYIFQSDFVMGSGINGGIPRFLSGFFKASLLLLILGNKNNKYKLRFWTILTVIVIVILIISGQRGVNSLFIIGVLMLYHYAIKPFTKKQAYKLLVLLLIAVASFSVISDIRNIGIGNRDISNVLEIILESLKSNPLTELIGEMGFTLIACTTVMVYCPSIIPYNHGATYYNSLFSLIPNLFWEVNPAASGGVDQVFKHLLFENSGMGSSFIIEAYYNFGTYGLLLMPLLGFFIGKLYFVTIEASNNKDYLKLYFCVYTSFIILWFVRSETITFYRNLTYYALLPVILIKIISILGNKTKKTLPEKMFNENNELHW
ncbi:MAG: O-antigen polysaccharide polymerase Wzy family protein [Desulfosporosinus sp.]|nr:O-antigen polysaccharide polymerase Wzy family protein [Desulfosporosinus sp.]